MNVLVTGATGFVGRHAIPHLLAHGHSVVAVARDEAKARRFAWYERVRFVACDVHKPIDDPQTLFDRPEAAMHLAWPGLPNYKSLFHIEVNLPADCRFLASIVRAGVRQVLVTGTCFEYGMQDGCLAEDALACPDNPYAIAKDTLRKFLQVLQTQDPFVLQWARLFYMHGRGQSPNSLLAQLDRAIDNGERVFNMSGGEQLRDYLPIDEVVARLVGLLEHTALDGVFNICSGVPISVRKLVDDHIAKRGARIRLNLGHYPYPDHEPMAFWGDPQKLAATLRS